MKKLATILLVASLLVASAQAPVQAQDDYVEEAAFGILAALTNVVYMPAKVVYAGVGALVGGLTYLTTAGDEAAATAAWGPPLGGTYVITGRMLRGDDSVDFVGRSRCLLCGSDSAEGDRVDGKASTWTEEPLP